MTPDNHLGGCDGGAGTWLPDIWERMIVLYQIRSVIDIGCGMGRNTKWFLDHGCEVLGVDGFPEYLKLAQIPIDRMLLHDYTLGPYIPSGHYDLGWCSEFVEHVEEKFAPNFLATFARCKHVCLTYATPGQGGYHHVNENTLEYWVEKMESIGFTHDADYTRAMRATGADIGYGRRTLTWFDNRNTLSQ